MGKMISGHESERVRVASKRGPYVIVCLGEAMEWKRRELTRKAVDVDAAEPVVEESEPVMRVGEERPLARRRLRKSGIPK